MIKKDKDIKILEVTPSYKPMWQFGGGVTRVAYELSTQLVKKDVLVSVCTLNCIGSGFSINDNDERIIDGVTVKYYAENKIPISRKICLCPSYRSIPIIKKDIQKYNLIHIHEFRGLLTLIIVHYAKKYNIPYIIQAHGTVPFQNRKVLIKKIQNLLFSKNILLNASALIALSKSEADAYKKFGVDDKKIHILPNGLDAKYLPVPAKGYFRLKHNIAPNTKIISYVGRINPTKSVEMLIDAFSKLHNEYPDTLLVLVGEMSSNEYETILRSKIQLYNIEKDIIVTGFVSSKEKKEAFVDSDVFVTPSYSGFPLTFLEACACQVPIVTTINGDDLGWIDGKVGRVTMFSSNALYQGIANILYTDDVNLYKKNEATLIDNNFNWKYIADKVKEIYITCIEEYANENE